MGEVYGVSGGQVNWGGALSPRGRAVVNFLALQMNQGLDIRINDRSFMDSRVSPQELSIMDENMNIVPVTDFQTAVLSIMPPAGFLQYLTDFISAAGGVSGRTLNLDVLVEKYNSGVSAADAAADREVISEPPPPPPGLPIEQNPPF